MSDSTFAVRFVGIAKAFPGVRALAGVTFDIQRGACHALVGENGAGKSTLGKVLAGIHAPDAGEVWVEGRRLRCRGPADAMAHGIGMVHQELLFCENLSVAENLSLGRLPTRRGFLSRGRMRDFAREALATLDADLDPDRTLGELPVAQQQLVQIAAAVARGARILVLDEPTSSLSKYETENLFRLMGRLRERGSTLIYVSHRLEEVFRVCDSVTVLRDGCVAATCRTAETDEAAVVRAMIGRSLDAYFPTHLERPPGEELLRVEGLTVPGLVEDVSLRVHAGEVVGMAGLVGAGRTETAEALFGLRRPSAGRVLLRGKPVAFGSPRAAMAQGIGLVPEDRKRHGLILGMTVRENTTLPFVSRLSRGGWVDRRRETALVGEYCRRLNVRTPSLSAPVAGLSGGNQQKLIIARWLAAECGVLLVDEPTRGVDVGAKAEIHGLVDRLAASGAGVLLISSELPELLNLSSRILVLRAGRVMAELPRAEATQEALMRHMAGLR